MNKTPAGSYLLNLRCAGVLLHITSLPCSESCWEGNEGLASGTLGKEAFKFVDFMAESGLRVWQMLPVVPPQADLSPYQAISVHAGNSDLISLDDLRARGWVTASDIVLEEYSSDGIKRARAKCAQAFYCYLSTNTAAAQRTQKLFDEFCAQQAYWLTDFTLYSALRTQFNCRPWNEWPEGLRRRDPLALDKIKHQLQAEIAVSAFEQFAFFTQWHALKNYAQAKGIYLFGDMPLFVGYDSADVWANPRYFHLDKQGAPITLAGVPPDSFSETGQCWGNPHYAWDVMQADGFQWWLARLRTQLQLFDLIRIDDFRGLEAYWAIPATTQDPRAGEWVKAPGAELLKVCFAAYPHLPLVAENLGLITENVERLRQQFQLPGMLVLQFAFDGSMDNPHLPHNHQPNDFIYTGTHDNDTTIGWYQKLSSESRAQITTYCFEPTEKMPWLLIKLALASLGRMAVIPMQDFLELGTEHKMNTPGTSGKNWSWKFSWEQLPPELPTRIKRLLETYDRLGARTEEKVLLATATERDESLAFFTS